MKSVTLVAFIGSWLRNSLTSRLRKSCELIVLEGRLAAALDEDDAEFVPETVMANSGSLFAACARRFSLIAVLKSYADQTDGAPNSGANLRGGID
jgi:hypothetical protein